jgi:hypothetical protein
MAVLPLPKGHQIPGGCVIPVSKLYSVEDLISSIAIIAQSDKVKYSWLNNTITDAWVCTAAKDPDKLVTHAISCSALNSWMPDGQDPWLKQTLELASQMDIVMDRWMHMFLSVIHQMFIHHLLSTAANTPVMVWKYQQFAEDAYNDFTATSPATQKA